MTGFIKRNASLFMGLFIIFLLLLIPTGYEDAAIYKESEKCVAKVIAVDDSAIISSGLIKSGEQSCTLKILSGKFKGEITEGYNLLSGSLESDKIFKVGDKALVLISHKNGEILSTNMVDVYRINKEMILAAVFVIFLVAFAKKTGLYAILSFAITVLSIWKILVPCCLDGINPIWVSLFIVAVLTLVIIVFVYGFDKRSLVASLGSLLGTITTCILGICFTDYFQIHGAVMSYSETLLYCGYSSLNLTQIFMSSIFIGASGAMMDLSVDITSAVYEVVQKKPDIRPIEAIKSGFNIGRAAMGTMTTTLLLAYSGGYLALLMTFMAQGTPIINILNYKYVSAEILQTIVGSFGLVTVAPFTAIVAGILLTRKMEK
ncbi:MAG: YibE/F family protein [Thermoflexaceae bacterium]|nr:YibE/F family protein [Thermoflexaceae bacterium]